MSEKKQHKQAEVCDAENVNAADNGARVSGTKSAGAAGENAPAYEAADKNGQETADSDAGSAGADDSGGNELEIVKSELEVKEKLCSEYLDKLQRTVAEFDNFKKRSLKEKEAIYIDAVSDVVCAFLPVIDNVERALQAISADSSAQTLRDGVEMVFRQFKDALRSIGVEEIKAVNEQFDPMRHNAVMHTEDEAYGCNTVVEEFQKGYIYKEKVIRFSMVKVAN